MATLPELFSARATVAYAVECLARGTWPPGQKFQDALARQKTIAYYAEVQAQILALSRDYAATWQRPRAPLVPNWCSICGNAERDRLQGHNACVVCEASAHSTENTSWYDAGCDLCTKEQEENHTTAESETG